MDIRDYMAGVLSLPPANGQDTSAPFFTVAPATTAVSPSLAAQTPAGASLTNTPVSNGTGVPGGPGTVAGGPATANGLVAPNTAAAINQAAGVAGASGLGAWYVQASQYIAIGLVAVILLALGFYILVSPSPVKDTP